MSATLPTAKTKKARRLGPYGRVGNVVDELDDRLGVAKGGRVFLDKIFPDHWSFMLGEIALYSFVVVMATGIFLALYFVPSTTQVIYHGTYAPLRGQTVSEAYQSTVNISFGVRGGLLVRQMHHWAADIFVGSIVVHMARIFFTGAFRKPRELNWIIGTVMLIMAILEGFIGYSLPDDLISGTGLRIGYSIVESIPFVGSYLATFLWGGQFPGNGAIEGRFYIIHVLIIPLVIIGTPGGPPRAAGAPEAHPVQGRGADRDQRGGVAHVPHLHGQDHRLPLHGGRRHGAPGCVRPDQPHLAVRLLQPLEDLLRRPAGLVHGLAGRGLAHHAVVGVRRLGPYHSPRGLPAGGDLPRPHLQHRLHLARARTPADGGQRVAQPAWTAPVTVPNARRPGRPCWACSSPCSPPVRPTCWPTTSMSRSTSCCGPSGSSRSPCPIVVGFVTYGICKEMQGVQGIGKRKRAVIVHRSAEGEYSTVTAAPRPGDGRVELDPEPVPVRIDIAPLTPAAPGANGESSPTGSRQVTR